MSKEQLDNWKRIKEYMEKENKTDNYFYTRAVAIVGGNSDPLEPLQ